MKDDLGDRMKSYEDRYSLKLLPMIPVLARIDGRSFSKLTKNLHKPYDASFASLMGLVAHSLCEETNAILGYVQSDEISLLYHTEDYQSEIFFAGKHSKMVSVLASIATRVFNDLNFGLVKGKAEFDCRVWQVPTKGEAVNYFIWRQKDAVRNALQGAARSVYSHKECEGKNRADLNEMLFQKGVNFNDYPSFFKRGSFYKRKYTETAVDPEMMKRWNAKIETRYSLSKGTVVRKSYASDYTELTTLEHEDRIKFCFENV